MHIEYDPEVDAAYIYVVHSIGPGEASRQVSSIKTPNLDSEIILDFDDEGRLLGIEGLGASDTLKNETLAAAIRLN